MSRVQTEGEATVLDRIQVGMSPKKVHEVACMAACMDRVAQHHNIRHVVDLGCGQGYLSRTLAYQYGMYVLAVDSSSIQTCGAKRYNDRLQVGKVEHITRVIDDAVSLDELLVEKYMHEKILLCGLHACGQLSGNTMRMFLECRQVQALVLVGCCYNLLEVPFVPCSNVCQQSRIRLSYTQLQVACQTPRRWEHEREATIHAIHKHCFRAILQLVIVHFGLYDKGGKVPRLGKIHFAPDTMDFASYMTKALQKLDATASHITAYAEHLYYSLPRALAKVAVVWTLRALLAPVLETFVLQDRLAYLHQHSISACLVPLFDETTSPRNMAILATKPQESPLS
jgi:SAM-dependent methyltransferase